jgi:hypothetical protein
VKKGKDLALRKGDPLDEFTHHGRLIPQGKIVAGKKEGYRGWITNSRRTPFKSGNKLTIENISILLMCLEFFFLYTFFFHGTVSHVLCDFISRFELTP